MLRVTSPNLDDDVALQLVISGGAVTAVSALKAGPAVYAAPSASGVRVLVIGGGERVIGEIASVEVPNTRLSGSYTVTVTEVAKEGYDLRPEPLTGYAATLGF